MIKELVSTSQRGSSITRFGRKNGNSTRLIDLAIQDLFDGKIVRITDSYENGLNVRANLDFIPTRVKKVRI